MDLVASCSSIHNHHSYTYLGTEYMTEYFFESPAVIAMVTGAWDLAVQAFMVPRCLYFQAREGPPVKGCSQQSWLVCVEQFFCPLSFF